MNLFDIVKRKDRCLEVSEGAAEAVHRGGRDGYLGVRFSGGARMRLTRAHEFTCLASRPRDIGWQLHTSDETPPPLFTISVHGTKAKDVVNSPLCHSEFLYRREGGGGAEPIVLSWPDWIGESEFDIELVNGSDNPVELQSSPFFNPRVAVASLMRGKGIEVGPGMNPFIKPSDEVDVTYVEALPIDEWRRNYDKAGKATTANEEFWQRYVIGDAQQLDCCGDASLDFIFCSHVFEHLMNPLGVLKNWSRKLKAGGVAVCVVPDLRYCFDLRQPPSTPADWLSEYETGAWTLTRPKYEKWCCYTAPYNTPEDLIKRRYSIHAHYYTPRSLRSLAAISIEKKFFSRLYLNKSPNNKDFAFVLWK